MAGRSPWDDRRSHTCATTGVLPVPPTRRLPTLTTACVSLRCRDGSRAYHRRRHEAAAPYTELSTLKINEPVGRVERRRLIRSAAAGRQSPQGFCPWLRDWLRPTRARRRRAWRG